MGVVITAAALDDLFTGFNTRFNDVYGTMEDLHLKGAMDVPVSSTSETFAWLDLIPGFREWVGSRQYNDVKLQGRNVLTKEWEDTIWIPRPQIESDNIGAYTKKVDMIAQNLKAIKAKTVFDLYSNGFSATGYDGQYFFDTDHTWRGRTVSNKLALALTATNFDTAVETLMDNLGSVGDNNEAPLMLNPEFTLMCGPSLRSAAREILEATLIGGGNTNTNFNQAELFINPLLRGSHANKWFVFVKNSALMPMVFVNRIDYELESITDPEAPVVFDKNAFAWGARSSFNADYGLWQLAIGSTGAS